MFGKIIDGILEYAPRNLKTDNGVILNFNKNIELMNQYGYKQIVDEKPEYDDATQELKIANYIENDNDITIVYEMLDKEQTLEERIINLENQMITQTSILSEEINK